MLILLYMIARTKVDLWKTRLSKLTCFARHRMNEVQIPAYISLGVEYTSSESAYPVRQYTCMFSKSVSRAVSTNV
jgi:hypothetical protein